MGLRSVLKHIRSEFIGLEFMYALLSLAPLLLGYFIFHNPLFLRAGLISISLYISASQLAMNTAQVTLQYLSILAGFSLLYFTQNTLVFAMIAALMAFVSVYITRYGAKLRTLGNYIFIPAVYLACEIHHALATSLTLPVYLKFIALTPLAWVVVVFLLPIKRYFAAAQHSEIKNLAISRFSFSERFFARLNKGELNHQWLRPALAVFIAVFIAATLAYIFPIDNSEWLIWSAVSVITLEQVKASHKKFLQRLSGGLLGVSLGLLIGYFLPKSEFLYSVFVLCIMLTLVSFKHYFIAFTSRCMFVALAASVITLSPHTALTRVENVFIGGLLGVTVIYLLHFPYRRRAVIHKNTP